MPPSAVLGPTLKSKSGPTVVPEPKLKPKPDSRAVLGSNLIPSPDPAQELFLGQTLIVLVPNMTARFCPRAVLVPNLKTRSGPRIDAFHRSSLGHVKGPTHSASVRRVVLLFSEPFIFLGCA